MTEIRIDVDLPHPPERVWTALTDPAVLGEWFMPTELSEDTATFTLRPVDVAGFDDPISGEIVEVNGPERLVVRWHATQLHTLVTVTIDPKAGGCRLTVVQRGFLGQQGTLRRRVLQRTYDKMVNTGLPPALDRLAEAERARQLARRSETVGPAGARAARRNQGFFAAVPRGASMAWAGIKAAGRNMSLRSSSAPGLASFRRRPARGVATAAGETLSESPTAQLDRGAFVLHRSWPARLLAPLGLTGLFGGGPGRRGEAHHRRRGAADGPPAVAGTVTAERHRGAVLTSVVLIVLLATFAVLVERLTQPAGSGASAPADPEIVLAPEDGLPNNPPDSGTATSSLPPDSGVAGIQVPLTATYRTDRTIVGGYEGVITVNNLTTKAINGWAVRVALPPLGLVVREVRGALAEQADREVRFSPVPETRVVPAGESVRFTFQVQGVGAPVECTIDGRACAGVPE